MSNILTKIANLFRDTTVDMSSVDTVQFIPEDCVLKMTKIIEPNKHRFVDTVTAFDGHYQRKFKCMEIFPGDSLEINIKLEWPKMVLNEDGTTWSPKKEHKDMIRITGISDCKGLGITKEEYIEGKKKGWVYLCKGDPWLSEDFKILEWLDDTRYKWEAWIEKNEHFGEDIAAFKLAGGGRLGI